jgi:hypothetical protein
MSDIRLFNLVGGAATELDGQASDLKNPLLEIEWEVRP